MQGKALVRQVTLKQYMPVVWVKDPSEPKGKRQLELEACTTKEGAETVIDIESAKNDVFFTDIKESSKKMTGEFYIEKGYYR
jgi:hypothetical protein